MTLIFAEAEFIQNERCNSIDHAHIAEGYKKNFFPTYLIK